MSKLILAMFLALAVSMAYAAEDNLHHRFKDEPQIEIFLEDVINDTGNPAVNTETFKSVFKDVLEDRVTYKFAYWSGKDGADVIVIAKIRKYTFQEKAMPMMFSTATLAADALAPKSSGTLIVDYEVKRASDGKVLLHYRHFATEERRPVKDMAQDAGFKYSAQKNINSFIYKAFHKPKKILTPNS